ncbi:ras-like protein family member 12 isoform X2 [Phyllostomus discolor]|uniref:small monomeric GTPase n=1 Tax=Phyllostomus discolor TaxID=89673 RepID=A0A7E6CDK1_9CHIR|nr:ras-like protein family member 12 isoform X2 [Phyllostomus discolor]
MSSVFGKPRAGSGQQSAPLEVNLAILGRRGSGKSALTVKFLTRRFISEYDPNLEDTYSSEETVDHQPVHLRVMDTADLDTPRNCERYLNWAHAFLVVYSVDSRQSFEGSGSYLELLALHAKETQRSYPTLLLGNKLDMAQYSPGTIQSFTKCHCPTHHQHTVHFRCLSCSFSLSLKRMLHEGRGFCISFTTITPVRRTVPGAQRELAYACLIGWVMSECMTKP